jgi:hypothetical protein
MMVHGEDVHTGCRFWIRDDIDTMCYKGAFKTLQSKPARYLGLDIRRISISAEQRDKTTYIWVDDMN